MIWRPLEELQALEASPRMHNLVLHVPGLYLLLVKEHTLLLAEMLISLHPLVTEPAKITACMQLAGMGLDIHQKDGSKGGSTRR